MPKFKHTFVFYNNLPALEIEQAPKAQNQELKLVKKAAIAE